MLNQLGSYLSLGYNSSAHTNADTHKYEHAHIAREGFFNNQKAITEN